jgi:alanyl-tRNA synthetase
VTERLYYADPCLRAFDTTVVEAREVDGHPAVVLAETAFYPTSGGQPHDTGMLNGVPVVDVFVDDDGRVVHVLSAQLPGERVHGEIDWPRRFDHMQQHTGQHLLSAVLEDLYGFHTVSVHFGQDASTLDLDASGITPDQVAAAEARANLVVTENRPVSIGFEDAAAAAGLRKPSDRAGPLRIVTIHELDRSACGGTHVRATGEIGAILIRKVERVRKAVRLEFLCGTRAVRRARADQELLARLAAQYSAAPDELPALVEAQRAELKDAVAGRREADAQLDRYRAAELYAGTAPDAAGLRRIVVREERGIDRLRGLAQAVVALPRAVFVGVAASPPGLLVAASEDSGRDAGAMLRSALAPAGGRGGGTPRLAQGTVGADALESVLEAVAR